MLFGAQITRRGNNNGQKTEYRKKSMVYGLRISSHEGNIGS